MQSMLGKQLTSSSAKPSWSITFSSFRCLADGSRHNRTISIVFPEQCAHCTSHHIRHADEEAGAISRPTTFQNDAVCVYDMSSKISVTISQNIFLKTYIPRLTIFKRIRINMTIAITRKLCYNWTFGVGFPSDEPLFNVIVCYLLCPPGPPQVNTY